MNPFLYFVDSLSAWVGKAFGWCIMGLTLAICYEVFMRYVLNAPTAWAFDMAVQMYGALFMMAGAYTLSRGGHVRGDFIYRLWKPRTQAKVELLYAMASDDPSVGQLVSRDHRHALVQVKLSENDAASREELLARAEADDVAALGFQLGGFLGHSDGGRRFDARKCRRQEFHKGLGLIGLRRF